MSEWMAKSDFMEQFLRDRAEWEKILSGLTPQKMVEPDAVGWWSVKDLIAHITWFEREMLGLLRTRALAGSELWNLPTDERNRVVFEQNRDRPIDEVLAESRQVYRDMFAELDKLTDEDFNRADHFVNFFPGLAPWEILRDNTYKHYNEHALDLRKWLNGK